MKVTICLIFAFLAITINAQTNKLYTTKYDNINLDEILSNDRLSENYLNCVLGKGKCTPDGAELRDAIPDALQNKCAKCNDKQKEGTKKVITHLVNNKPQWWASLKEKFDPEGIYTKQYEEQYKDVIKS